MRNVAFLRGARSKRNIPPRGNGRRLSHRKLGFIGIYLDARTRGPNVEIVDARYNVYISLSTQREFLNATARQVGM